eukprot:TRINITY_DN53_c0_g1_i1.p1 TRINITY_DN53_c0_g1~~TRINITY_DN53_c0_g1_i1.p1  ORF type:complete len:1166 (-),score=350.31 TRINITY_DN53_c0_g1_i1:336-3833(-)
MMKEQAEISLPSNVSRKKTGFREEKSLWDDPEAYHTTYMGVIESADVAHRYENMGKDPEAWRATDLIEHWAQMVPDPERLGKFASLAGWDPEADTDEEAEDLEVNHRYTLDKDDDEMDFGTALTEKIPSKWDRIHVGDLPMFPGFYVPYKKHYPPFYVHDPELESEEGVIQLHEKLELYQQWYSYVFPDGTMYEGTVFNDMAQGKGVYTTPWEFFRYEGEWHQNMMHGHGVLEVDVPDMEPVPDSIEARSLRARGHILKTDYIPQEERKWLKKDIADVIRTKKRIPYKKREIFDEWFQKYHEIPESGHYRYAGQWKHSRMHGCGVYEVNGQMLWGKFYFGKFMAEPVECTAEISALHAGLAEVAAAKARMFANKPDGMVRELRGPFNDPQHPYMYEEEDMWMAPGFANQFYEVPDPWKKYAHDVDQEREMWLNSFYKSPLRIPMPSELEYWWSKDPNFVRIGNHKDDEDDELLLHLPTGKLINWVEDDEGRVRLFYQPKPKIKCKKNGQVIPKKEKDDNEFDPADIQFLPLGFDEFIDEVKEETEEGFYQSLAEEEKKLKDKWEQLCEERKKMWDEEDEVIDLENHYAETQEQLEEVLKGLLIGVQEKQKLEELSLKLKQEIDELKEMETKETTLEEVAETEDILQSLSIGPQDEQELKELSLKEKQELEELKEMETEETTLRGVAEMEDFFQELRKDLKKKKELEELSLGEKQEVEEIKEMETKEMTLEEVAETKDLFQARMVALKKKQKLEELTLKEKQQLEELKQMEIEATTLEDVTEIKDVLQALMTGLTDKELEELSLKGKDELEKLSLKKREQLEELNLKEKQELEELEELEELSMKEKEVLEEQSLEEEEELEDRSVEEKQEDLKEMEMKEAKLEEVEPPKQLNLKEKQEDLKEMEMKEAKLEEVEPPKQLNLKEKQEDLKEMETKEATLEEVEPPKQQPSDVSMEEEEEDDDEQEEPRSFGTVAFSPVEQRSIPAISDKRKTSPASSPTIFASLSLVPQALSQLNNPLTSWVKSIRSLSSNFHLPVKMQPTGHADMQHAKKLKSTPMTKHANYPTLVNLRWKTTAIHANKKLNQILHSNSRHKGCSPYASAVSRLMLPKPNSLKDHRCYQKSKLHKESGQAKHQSLTIHDVFNLAVPIGHGSVKIPHFSQHGTYEYI